MREPDAIDREVERTRRLGRWSALALVVSLPCGVLTLAWAIRNPSNGHMVVAVFVGSAVFVPIVFVVSSLWLGDRDRYIRYLNRPNNSVYHDPSPTRRCPRCGLPMDRLMGGAFYTGPASPRELCHRCLHSDDLGLRRPPGG